MFAHAQQKYTRSVHRRFVAAQDFLINRPRSISKCNISLWDDVAWGSTTSS
jgi:hypothetical protein